MYNIHSQLLGTVKPLGRVDIPLVNFSSDGETREEWYDLEAFGSLKPGRGLGRIHLKVKIGAMVNTRDASSRFLLDTNRAMAGRGDEEEGYRDQPPNFLRVTLHGVRSSRYFVHFYSYSYY